MREKTPRPVMLYVEDGMFMGKEIVFCKDCKYWTECSFFVPSINFCGRLRKVYKRGSKGVEFEMDADDFCSRGERRGEEEC